MINNRKKRRLNLILLWKCWTHDEKSKIIINKKKLHVNRINFLINRFDFVFVIFNIVYVCQMFRHDWQICDQCVVNWIACDEFASIIDNNWKMKNERIIVEMLNTKWIAYLKIDDFDQCCMQWKIFEIMFALQMTSQFFKKHAIIVFQTNNKLKLIIVMKIANIHHNECDL